MPQVIRAAALGFFDGIHIGHAALMRRLLEIRDKTGSVPAVITFDTLPQNLIEGKTTRLINSPEDRTGLIQRMFGIDEIIFLRFDKKMAAIPWDEFIDSLVIDYNIQHFVAGRNFKFGTGARGNHILLEQKCSENGLGCEIIHPVVNDGVVSSSTHIRQLLTDGSIEWANAFLGHPHVLTDVIRSGRKLGSSFGTPTLNMRFAPDVLVPAYGVYATRVYIENADSGGLAGVTNIGTRPTVDNSGQVTVETHIPGFNQDLYGSKVRVEFYKYLRREMVFGSTDDLKAQIQRDCIAAAEYFDACNTN